MKGIIIENKSNLYKVASIEKENEGTVYESKVRGKFKQENISPVVGDFVEIEVLPKEEEKEQAIIEKIMPRNVFIKRPKIANITQMIFVVSSKNPKPDLIMLDKQLAFAEFMGVNAVIVLNKIDLDKDKQFEQIQATYEKIGYKVIKTMAKDFGKVEEIKNVLKNNINVFSGNSGVGKSTLINSIFEKEVTEEGQISQKNKRGKNTTTKTRLYEIEKETYIADTPGFSTFDISEIASKDLAKYFKEFEKFISKCEFLDCTHIKEENCAIKKAIESKEISSERYERFCKIYNELKEKEERKRW